MKKEELLIRDIRVILNVIVNIVNIVSEIKT